MSAHASECLCVSFIIQDESVSSLLFEMPDKRPAGHVRCVELGMCRMCARSKMCGLLLDLLPTVEKTESSGSAMTETQKMVRLCIVPPVIVRPRAS